MSRLKARSEPLKAVKIYQDDYEYLYREYLKHSLEAGKEVKLKRFGIFADEIHHVIEQAKKEDK